jgi:hypothetical protein
MTNTGRVQRAYFKERLIYEQSAMRTLREQQQKRPFKCARQPMKLYRCVRKPASGIQNSSRLFSARQSAFELKK